MSTPEQPAPKPAPAPVPVPAAQDAPTPAPQTLTRPLSMDDARAVMQDYLDGVTYETPGDGTIPPDPDPDPTDQGERLAEGDVAAHVRH
jgi:hypothetical protein